MHKKRVKITLKLFEIAHIYISIDLDELFWPLEPNAFVVKVLTDVDEKLRQK